MATTTLVRTPKPLSLKKLDMLIQAIYSRVGNGVQIDMFDISKVFNVAREAYATALREDADPVARMSTAMSELLAKIRKN
jgi:hypothetical protein